MIALFWLITVPVAGAVKVPIWIALASEFRFGVTKMAIWLDCTSAELGVTPGAGGVYTPLCFTSSVSEWNTPSPPYVPSRTTPRPSLKRAGTAPVLMTDKRVEPSVTTKRTIAPEARTLPGTT